MRAPVPAIGGDRDDPEAGAELGEVLLHLYVCALVMLAVATILLA